MQARAAQPGRPPTLANWQRFRLPLATAAAALLLVSLLPQEQPPLPPPAAYYTLAAPQVPAANAPSCVLSLPKRCRPGVSPRCWPKSMPKWWIANSVGAYTLRLDTGPGSLDRGAALALLRGQPDVRLAEPVMGRDAAMSRCCRCLILVGLWLWLAACSHNPDFARVGDSATADERRLLVTFVDRTIGRHFTANPQDSYASVPQYHNSGWSGRMARALAERHHLQLIAQWPMTELGVSCVVYEVPPDLPLPAAIAALQQDSEVATVQAMHRFQVLGKTMPLAANSTAGDPYGLLQASFQALGIADWHRLSTGRGVRIALIDTGVDGQHPDLQGQIRHFENLAPEPDDHNVADIHGTAVLGVLAARPNNGIGIAGIAPDADIFAFRACWPDSPRALAAHCNSFTLALALNEALRMGSRIINLSLSGPDDPLLRQLLDKAVGRHRGRGRHAGKKPTRRLSRQCPWRDCRAGDGGNRPTIISPLALPSPGHYR